MFVTGVLRIECIQMAEFGFSRRFADKSWVTIAKFRKEQHGFAKFMILKKFEKHKIEKSSETVKKYHTNTRVLITVFAKPPIVIKKCTGRLILLFFTASIKCLQFSRFVVYEISPNAMMKREKKVQDLTFSGVLVVNVIDHFFKISV